MSAALRQAQKLRRETPALLARAGQTVFSPAGFFVWDAADVEVWRRLPGGDWARMTDGYTVAKTGPEEFSAFAVTLAAGAAQGTAFRFADARVHARPAGDDVLRDGALAGRSLERELDRQATTMAAIATANARALRAAPDGLEIDLAGRRLTGLADGEAPGDAVTRRQIDAYLDGSFPDIIAAQTAQAASDAATAAAAVAPAQAAQAGAEAARDAALAAALPNGGATASVLAKASNAEDDAAWTALRMVADGGNVGQLATRTAGGHEWADLPQSVESVNGNLPVNGNLETQTVKAAFSPQMAILPGASFWMELGPVGAFSQWRDPTDPAFLVIPDGVHEIDIDAQVLYDVAGTLNLFVMQNHVVGATQLEPKGPPAWVSTFSAGHRWLRLQIVGMEVEPGDVIRFLLQTNGAGASEIVASESFVNVKVNR